MQVRSKKKVLLLGTGGTIAGKANTKADNVGYVAGALAIEDVLPQEFLSAVARADLALVTKQVAQLDSKDMDHPTWFELAALILDACADDSFVGVVITHGTDTIEETSCFLASVCPEVKPIVLTCAMRPATALTPDGPQNLIDALSVVLDQASNGVSVVAAGFVHHPMRVVKVHPYRTDAFESGEKGPIAVVEEGCVRWFETPANRPPQLDEHLLQQGRALLSHLAEHGLPRVEWIVSHAGANRESVDVWLRASTDSNPLRGLLVVCTGNGTFAARLTDALREAETQGYAVWRSTRCTASQMVLGTTSYDWPTAVFLDPVKARITMSVAIARDDSLKRPAHLAG